MSQLGFLVLALLLLHLCTLTDAVGEEEVLQSLVADDACHTQESGPACGLGLLQLLAQRVQPFSSFEFVGEDMWQQPTWEAVLAQIAANASAEACSQDTLGTCNVVDCSESRGAATCVAGKCICQPGQCAHAGVCFPGPGQCIDDTGGKCSIMGCSRTRGATHCEGGNCFCKKGGCARNGQCFPVTDLGVACKVTEDTSKPQHDGAEEGGCAASRGPTICHKGRCICRRDHVAVAGRCERTTW